MDDTRTLAAAKIRSVLLVEDDELVRERLQLLFERVGLDMHSAPTAAAARAAMSAVVFPIVVIDRMLPGEIDGIQLIQEFRRRYSDHRVFLFVYSTMDSPEALEQGLAAGADDYLSKKLPDEELLRRVRTAMHLVQLSV